MSPPRLPQGVVVGEGTVIEPGAEVGARCRIGHHAVVRSGVVLGPDVQVGDGAILGKEPMKAARSATTREQLLPPARIGARARIGANAVVYRGSLLGDDVFLGDFASVREEVEVGAGTIVGRAAVVENRCRVGARCKIEAGVYVAALSEIGDDCFLAPEVTITNDNFLGRTRERFKRHKGAAIGNGARIGANATLLPGIRVGEEAVVAAGSVVTKDVPPRKIVMGVPARAVRDVPREQFVENDDSR